jgi:tripartite-type tricarboxylate transporter receptor subunit TctC
MADPCRAHDGPIAAGGGIDAVTRLAAARLSEIWRQQVVVENRTGGSGNIAAEAVARSSPTATPSSPHRRASLWRMRCFHR